MSKSPHPVKLLAFTDEQLKEELQRRLEARITNPIDNWQITTEGDCEGRSVKTVVAAEKGHIGDLLCKYGKTAMYQLNAQRVEAPKALGEADWSRVSALGLIKSPSNPLTPENMAEIRTLIGDAFDIRLDDYHCGFTIRRRMS